MADYAEPSENKASPKSKEDFIATARRRFQEAIDASSENRKSQLDDVKFYAGSPDNGWQWPDDLRRAREKPASGSPRPTLTINKLPQHLRQITNEQRQNRPAIKVIPVDDKGDPEVAEILNGMVRHIEANSDADIAYDTAGECQVKSGEGYFRVLTDYCDEMSFDQDILIRRIRNPFSVYMDPSIQDPSGADQQWCFITDEIDKDEFKAQFPKAKPIDWSLNGMGDDQKIWFEGNKVRIAEYFCFKNEKTTLYLWADGSVTKDGEQPPFMGASPVNTRTAEVKKIMWSKINGQEILEERDWAGKYIPVVRVVGNEEDVEGKVIASGIVRNSKDPQRMVNYWTSQEAEMLALAPKAPFVGAVGQFEGLEDKWQRANTDPFAYLEYNVVDVNGTPVAPPQRQMPPMPPAGIINAKLGAADDLKATMGQYNPSLGQEGQAKSGIAIGREQKKAEISNFHYLDNLARAIRHGGRIILDLIPKIYDTKRVARILGEDGEPDHVTLDPEQGEAIVERPGMNGGIEKIYNPSIGKYDVRVTVGPGYTTKRQEAAEFMAQVLQGNNELMAVMGDLYFAMLDVPGADKISERMKKTLPPNLRDEEEGAEQMVQTPQGPIPISKIGPLITDMTAQLQGMAEQLKSREGAASEAKLLDQQNKEKQLAIDAERLGIDRMDAQTRKLTAEAGVHKTDAEIKKIIFDSITEYVKMSKEDDDELARKALPQEEVTA